MAPSHASLIDLLGPDAPVIDIVDIGAAELEGPPGTNGPIERLFKPGKHTLVGFEPILSECEKLNAKAVPGRRFLPYFIGDGSPRTFHLTAASMCSSLFEPNMDILRRFQTMPEMMEVVDKGLVQTVRLDDVPDIRNIDYLKVDVQGAELDVLRNGRRAIANAALIEAEVEFLEIYKGQPLFPEVHAELVSQGFMLHTMHRPSGRCYWPFVFNGNPNSHGSQAIWTDAFYVPDVRRFGELPPERLLKVAVLVHELLTSFDLAALALQHYDKKRGTKLWQKYMGLFMPNPPESLPIR